MLDVAALLQTTLYDNWTETNPTNTSIAWKTDEYDSKDPKLQVLLENFPDRKVWVTNQLYRIEHRVKLTLFLKPTAYDSGSITTAKTLFLNAKTEIDRILELNKFLISGVNNLDLKGGWDDKNTIAVGRGSKNTKEPIQFKSEQLITAIYYNETAINIPVNPILTTTRNYITESDYLIIVDDDDYYSAINGRTFLVEFGGVNDAGEINGLSATDVVNACVNALTDGGLITIMDPLYTHSPILLKNNIWLVGNSMMGGGPLIPDIIYDGTDYAIREFNENTWRSFGISQMCIENTDAEAKGMIRLGKCDFGTVKEVAVIGYASESAINIPHSSQKGNTKKIEDIRIEGELKIALGVDCQSDWCWLHNVVISKTTLGAVKIGDQVYDEPPYECRLDNVHGYNCQTRFLDIEWAYYLMAVQCIDEHDANWVGEYKESSWYQAPASEEGKEGKVGMLLNCHAYADTEAGHPPEGYIEFIDKQHNLVFMRNDNPSKGDGEQTGLKVMHKLIVDDYGKGVPDVMQVIGKHSDLLRLSNTDSYKVDNVTVAGKEIVFALDAEDFKIWNITDAHMLLQLSWAGVLRPRDIIPFVNDSYDLGNNNYIFNTLHIKNIYLHDTGVFYMNGVAVMVFDDEDRLLQNIQIDASDCDRGTLPNARLSGTTTSVTVRDAAGTGTITLYFVNGLFKYTVP